jgi:hypothetical protein
VAEHTPVTIFVVRYVIPGCRASQLVLLARLEVSNLKGDELLWVLGLTRERVERENIRAHRVGAEIDLLYPLVLYFSADAVRMAAQYNC